MYSVSLGSDRSPVYDIATSATAEPVSRTASIAGRIESTLFNASKIRKMSMPVVVASCTNDDVTDTGYGV